ncbi:MAG: hypothetical protein A3E31_11015 [Candidatus Rokubacteria bacterium RIFCSPHIGHO2_12_FULL_73_22]|nr:MAG: hypothetical protein A3E31_11015 [Candidatus Rokubacteria bacterium RIFCSPHIGHO2_12_FULL_73_22]OGL01275.1 MAG: hypothetical protein A3D33_09005 [Candidatus Rokubacteria bacterium RIFCSPHIGHO2_02_FULL_73_26]OGL08705.1 MAG: hypothetical protein A3I14_12755 [Candidatus Rokubacteria bacterium RIFCSPLOWO2_02_FULL_73_56]OGL29307.1 MAG: hypothetical protein A3G44_06490 [Candidatus Rokubacteria bacterium RIFCSPLOWO2_12_FULL_73_47]
MIPARLGLVALAALSVLVQAEPVLAGCKVTISGTYQKMLPPPQGFEYRIGVLRMSEVRIKLGTWKSMENMWSGTSVLQGQSFTRGAELDLGCNNARRYRFRVSLSKLRRGPLAQGPDITDWMSAWLYFPSESGWTESTSIALGDLARLFNVPSPR